MKFLIAVVLILATGVSVESRGRIFGGSVADPTKYRFLCKTSVPISSTRSFVCGASVISYSWILGAAHCFDAGDVSNTKVWMGLDATHQFTKIVKAIRVIKHKDYYIDATTVINDIALVEIPNVVQFDQIRTIWLAKSSSDILGQTVKIAGFGLNGVSSRPSQLQVTSLTVMDDDTCFINLGHSYRSTQFCTFNPESSTCQGDSGGPVTRGEGVNVELLGIVSYGPSVNCSEVKASAYTRVSSYLQWIKEITGLQVT